MSVRIIPDYLKDRVRELPDTPGVYFFRDDQKRAIYIGKALSLRKRAMGHFRSYGETFSKEGIMLSQVKWIDVIETPTEAEALLLESSMVKENNPKYNQELKDDKSYPFLKITGEEFPRLLIARGRKADGGRYFGPYTDTRLLRQAVNMLRRQFPLRTCKSLPAKACLMFHIGQCGAPCDGTQSKEKYMETVNELERFLMGRRDALVKSLSRRMKEFASNREYEKAQIVFSEIKALSMIPKGSRREGSAQMKVLEDMKEALGLPNIPGKMECFDISNIMGKEAVGSMVVFVDGRPSRADYRRFRIKTVEGIDDYKMMREVLRRRYGRAIEEKQTLTDLVIIDGGKGHLSAAKAELDDLGLKDLPVISIAKQHEYIFKPDREAPFVFSPTSPFLHLVRHIRDEAHRFAITYHRMLHKKEAMISRLDSIPGVGRVTKEKILRKIGSVTRVRTMTETELATRAGLTEKTARKVLDALKASTP